ncbi:MAG: hypothetical protein HZB91_13785 [Elusimicrobia bacterium]|nr:hypothetical protein [Elusimicrobiota bacterium]
MRVVTIGIKSEPEAMREFATAFDAAQKRLPVKVGEEVSFTSLEAARNFLTPKRLQAIRLIKEKAPESIYRLAKLAGRSFPSMLRDVNLLSRHGLVKLRRIPASPRRSVHPEVGYDAINLWIGI